MAERVHRAHHLTILNRRLIHAHVQSQDRIFYIFINSFPVKSKNPESCVFDKIFTDYHKEVRPVYNISDAIDLEFKFVFRSLGGIVGFLYINI